MARTACVLLLSAAFLVAVSACDKSSNKPPALGSGSASVAAGNQAAAAAAGSQAAASAAGSQAAPPAAANQAAAPAGGAPGPGATAPNQPPPATPATASAPAENPLKVGVAVDGQWTDGRWYPGKIGAINADGTFRVNYSDGDVSKSLPASKVRLRRAGATHAAGGGSCRGGLTQCGGRCVDIHNDSHNCNACGRTCPEACMGGSCVSNHYKYGN